MIALAAAFATIGVGIIGGWWTASDEGSGTRRPATTMTPQRAARVAASLVWGLEADPRVPVLHCKLATPRQRYSCRSARRLTAADLAAEILTPPRGSHRPRCFVKSEEGDLWTIEAGPDECRSWG